ncbi:hypothetical protein PPYR_14134 [Photinus pyralis]|uniref:EF-hand domain-containing protein n=1 Tax=Photinus pyralis TaxID=7054 RepID=A0A1Y1KWF7_PHOPY|nr:nucleobindin-2 isoform X2 [Photinus pyralis]KAB0792175.1 hypothetical protein PPYR_14134 [Photinus pyralis]
MKSSLIGIFLLSSIWQGCVAPPVTKNEESPSPETVELLMHYQHYLQEVVNALEKDPEFKKKLDSADQEDIKSGKIATELHFVSHHVRTQLDELKRKELDRLRTLNRQQHELTENDVGDDPSHGHLDRSNPHTFEVADLKKLIAKTMETLEEHDRKRRAEFKEYELQKEYEKFEKLNHTNGAEHEKLEKEYKEQEEKLKKHEPLHEPGHKAHIEEVWEEQDHMQQDFDPKTFFMMHDLDGNGAWDQNEVKALFVKELNKMYKNEVEGYDMVERAEEMERMRETVFKQMDTNRDGVIDYHEFLMQTQREEYQQDHGWKGLDEQKPYTDEELDAYIREQQRLHPPPYYPPPAGQGYVPPPPGAYNPNVPPPQGAYPNSYQGQYEQVHPNMNQGYAPPVQQNVPHPQQAVPQPPVANPAQPAPVQAQPPVPNQAQAQPPVQVQGQPPVQNQPPVQVQDQAVPQPPVQQAQPVAGQPNYQQPPQPRH